MSLYNTSFMNNATNLVDLMVGVGNVMGDNFLLGNLIMIGFALIFLILAMRQDFLEVFIIDCFLTTLLGIGLWTVGMVAVVSFTIPLVMFSITLIFYLTFR